MSHPVPGHDYSELDLEQERRAHPENFESAEDMNARELRLDEWEEEFWSKWARHKEDYYGLDRFLEAKEEEYENAKFSNSHIAKAFSQSDTVL